jgi:DNA-binding response OmpR family regulator
MNPLMKDTLLSGKKLLLIEEDATIQSIIRDAFHKCNCTVVAVGKARDGLECLQRDNFDIIVCEFDLTDSDGLAFFDQARRYRQKAVNILLIDYGENKAITSAFDQGVDHMFEKPFSLVAFMQTICDHLVRIETQSRTRSEPADVPEALEN